MLVFKHTLALPLGNLAQCVRALALCQTCMHGRHYPVPLRNKPNPLLAVLLKMQAGLCPQSLSP